jgi:hypothetical protein
MRPLRFLPQNFESAVNESHEEHDQLLDLPLLPFKFGLRVLLKDHNVRLNACKALTTRYQSKTRVLVAGSLKRIEHL